MLLKACELEQCLKYITFFDELDKEREGVQGKTEEEIIDIYIESFRAGADFYNIADDRGFLILERKENLGGFHIYLKKEFRNAINGLEILTDAIEKLKDDGAELIYTLACGRNKILLERNKKFEFKNLGEYKGFSLYQLI